MYSVTKLSIFFHLNLSSKALGLLVRNRCRKLGDGFCAVKNLEFRFQNSLNVPLPAAQSSLMDEVSFSGSLVIPQLEDLEVALPKGGWMD